MLELWKYYIKINSDIRKQIRSWSYLKYSHYNASITALNSK